MNRWLSYSKLAIAQAIIGLNFVLAKLLMPYCPMNLLLFFRFTIGALIMGVLCYAKGLSVRTDIKGHRLTRGDGFILVTQAMCAGFLFNLLILAGLQYTEASTAGIISSTTPAAIAVLSYFILKEILTIRQVFSIGLSVLGVFVISLGDQTTVVRSDALYGNILVLIAVIPEALFTVIAKWYKKSIHCYSLTFIICAINAVLFLPLALASMKYYVPMTDLTQLVLLIIYGTVGSSGFFIFWYQGLEHAPASIAALFTAVMPVSACVLGAWFLNETMTLYDLSGIALVIISIMLGSFTFKNLRKKTILFND